MEFMWTLWITLWKYVLSIKRSIRLIKMINTYYWGVVIAVLLFMIMYFSNWKTDRMGKLHIFATTVPSTPEQKYNSNLGCKFPKVDPFSEVAMKYDVNMSKIICEGEDWVKCNLSECRVSKHILNTTGEIVCHYKDIIYINDHEYKIAEPVTLYGDSIYKLNRSDGVRVSCTSYGKTWYRVFPRRWYGYQAGLRPIKANQSDNNTINILMVGFDSASHNGFIRKMPKSYKYLKEEIGAVILNGYNIVGDGTPDALFPILSGRLEQQHPPARKRQSKNIFLDPKLLIFHTAKKNGYETAYLEDMPWIGTFQYRFNGFLEKPADHYLRSFFMEDNKNGLKWHKGLKSRYCFGATLQYLFLLDFTRQFMSLTSKRFCFTFMSDISHDDLNVISTADDDLVDFLKHVKSNLLEDTMVIVMGDHGPRFSAMRTTFQGKIEERMPLMSIILPERLKRERPDALKFLKLNADVLTTPFDIHTTMLDAMGLREHASDFVQPNSNMRRGLSLLEPISELRSCSDAGVLPFWCVCTNVQWREVSKDDPRFRAVGNELLLYVNKQVSDLREICAERKLTSIEWVILNENEDLKTGKNMESFQTMIVTSPGRGIFEGCMHYDSIVNLFVIKEVSRISAYGNEARCVDKTLQHLNNYCYCKDILV